jgi:hypothetical protein
MKVLWHKPPSTRSNAMELRQSYKSEFGVSRVDELEGLRNAVASHEPASQGVENPKRLHGLDGSSPVRGGLGIGDRELRKLVRRKRRLSVGNVEDPAPEHEFANRIGEAAIRYGEALLYRKPWPLLVGGKKHLEGRVMGDLSQEGARSAENQDRLVASLFTEAGGDLARRFGEVGRDSHVGFGGFCASRKSQPKQPEGGCNRSQSHAPS